MPEFKFEKMYDVGTSHPIVARISLQMANLLEATALNPKIIEKAKEICFSLMEKFLKLEELQNNFLNEMNRLPGFKKSTSTITEPVSEGSGDFSKLPEYANAYFECQREIQSLFFEASGIIGQKEIKDLIAVSDYLKEHFKDLSAIECKILGEHDSLEELCLISQRARGLCLSVQDIKIEKVSGFDRVFSKVVSEAEPLDEVLTKMNANLFNWIEEILACVIITNCASSVRIKVIPESERKPACPIRFELEQMRNALWLPYFGYYWWEAASDKAKIGESETDLFKRIFYVDFRMDWSEGYKQEDSPISLEEERTIHQEHASSQAMDLKFFKNQENRLRMISCRIEASKKHEAIKKAYNSVLRLLGLQSFMECVPTSFNAMIVKDDKHEAVWFCKPQRSSPAPLFIPKEASISKEFEILLSIYREAKNNPSPYYRFLCYYKILEAFYKHRYIFSATDKIIKNKNLPFARLRRKITKDMLIMALIPHRSDEFEGLAYGTYYEKLTSNERIMIAHVFPERGKDIEWANLSDHDLHCEFVSLGNLTDLVARDIIYDEIELVTKIHLATEGQN